MSPVYAAAACFAERIKINRVTREQCAGRPMWVKRRRATAAPVLACANRFFRLAGNPVQALDCPVRWQLWEVDCFLALHGDRYQARAHGARGVAAEELPGTSLADLLTAGRLMPEVAAAAARELRRAHQRYCPEFHGAWSHGDPHAGNFLYHEAEERARLIDFEVMHDPTLSADERHADDLLIFLQDVLGRVSRAAWLPIARAFLDAYDREEIVARLARRLVLPGGLPRLWWAIRTTYLPAAEVTHRLAALRTALREDCALAAC